MYKIYKWHDIPYDCDETNYFELAESYKFWISTHVPICQ